MAGKEETLACVRAALGRSAQAAAPDSLAPFSHHYTDSADENVVDQFCAQLERVSGRAARVRSIDEIKDYIGKLLPEDAPAIVAVSDGFAVNRSGLREWAVGRGAQVVPSLAEFASADSELMVGSTTVRECFEGASLMERYKRVLIEAAIGVTSADYAIADTGTLVLVSGGEQHRNISLVPPVHVCLLDMDRITANLAELIARVHEESYSKGLPPQVMTFITGPSRTADIELSLTLGVHGPRELHVLLYSSEIIP
ncbi:MAG: lactate utilization protein [Blastocatellia bacterium]|nr:lactate utilization protein [Blastocatellia bacterium]